MARPKPKKSKSIRRKATTRKAPRGGQPKKKKVKARPSRRAAAKRVARRPTRRAAPARKVEEFDEKGFVKQTLLELTGVHFDEVEPHPAFPLAAQNLEWFMRCRNREEIALSPYLNTVWKDREGRIWLESLAIGDTIDWIELAYGDERATQSLDLDYSRFEDKSFEVEFERKYPIVMGRIREYERTIDEISRKNRVRLELRRAGSKGILVFAVAARVDRPEGTGSKSLRTALEKNVLALREAYEAIGKL